MEIKKTIISILVSIILIPSAFFVSVFVGELATGLIMPENFKDDVFSGVFDFLIGVLTIALIGVGAKIIKDEIF